MENNEQLTDIELVCGTCGKPFVHNVKDQLFYKEMGFENMPKACRDCRKAKKEARNNGQRNSNNDNVANFNDYRNNRDSE